MAAGDAVPIPRKNIAYRAYFEIRSTTGALISGATALDSEVSIDGAAFVDATAEATEIGASGTYFLDLTAAEMNGDGVVVVVKTTSAMAIIPVLSLYPESLGDIRVNVGQWNGTAVPAEDTAGYPKITVKDGVGVGEINTTAGQVEVTTAQLVLLINAIYDELTAEARVAGSYGQLLKDNLPVLITPANKLLTDAAGRVETTAAQLVTTVNAIYDELTAEARTAGSYGQLLKDNLPVLVTPANKLLTDAAGRVELQADGVDQIVMEAGLNLRQGLAVIASAAAGVLAGVGTATITIRAANNPGTLRITCVNDLIGNRSTVTLTPPA